MKILSNKKVKKLFLQVYDHRGLIPNLDDIQRTYLSDYISLRIHDRGDEPGSEMHKLYAQLNPNLSKEALQYRLETDDITEEMKPEAPEKEYNQLKVARAFCLWELFNAGKLENYYQIRSDGYYRFKRKIFEGYIKSKFKLVPPESSATIYAQAIQFINSKRYEFYTKQSPEYSRDYNYGLKLFNTMQ